MEGAWVEDILTIAKTTAVAASCNKKIKHPAEAPDCGSCE